MSFHKVLEDAGLVQTNVDRLHTAVNNLHAALCLCDNQQLQLLKKSADLNRLVKIAQAFGKHEPASRSEF